MVRVYSYGMKLFIMQFSPPPLASFIFSSSLCSQTPYLQGSDLPTNIDINLY
jgi:hypothetical protein